YQKEVNEICVERIAKNVNPLALVVDAQQYPDPYYQAPKSQKSYAPPSKQSSSTRSNASTKYKVLQKIYKSTNNNLKTSSNSKNKNVDTSPRYKNDNQTGQFRNQRIVTVVRAKETVGSQVVQQTGIQCFNCREFDIIMSSDEASSAVTYTSIFSDYEEPSDAGSPGVFVYGYDGLPMLLVDLYVEVTLQALPFLDCMSIPKEPEQAPPLPDYIPGPEYPEYLRIVTVVRAKETIGSQVVQQTGIQCFNCREFGYFSKECRKPKRLADMDEEIDEQELEADYSYMAMIQETDQSDVGCYDERVALANFTANLKLDVDENKKI
nr:hypothetical protein [Tanacetum cinerariifolium]